MDTDEIEVGDSVKVRYFTDDTTVEVIATHGDHVWVLCDKWLAPTTVPKESLYA